MQVAIPNAELLKALTGLSMIVPRKSSLPILANVLVKVAPGAVTLSATDLDQYAECAIENADADGTFSVPVPLSGLRDFARLGAKNGHTLLSLLDDAVRLVDISEGQSGISRSFDLVDAADYPSPPPAPVRLDAGGPGFLDTYRALLPSASTDPTRKTLGGVHVSPTEMVATNGRQLGYAEFATGIDCDVIVPATRFLASTQLQGDCRIGLSFPKDATDTDDADSACPTHLSVSAGRWLYQVRLIEGLYPNWRQVVPADQGMPQAIRFVEDTGTLVRQLRRLDCGDDPHKTVGLHIEGTTLRIVSGNSSDSRFETAILLDGTQTTRHICLNRDYLIHGLELGHRTVRLSSDNRSPMLFEGGIGRLVVMPIFSNVAEDTTPGEASETTESGTTTATPFDGPTAANANEKENESMATEHATGIPAQGTDAPVRTRGRPRKEDAESAPSGNTGFRIVGEAAKEDASPFDELQSLAEHMREQLGVLQNLQRDLPRKIKALQNHLKDRERDFRQAREVIDKMRKVSGF